LDNMSSSHCALQTYGWYAPTKKRYTALFDI
jgi:hypothetical protein